MNFLRPLRPGSDLRRNWKSINEVIAGLRAARNRSRDLGRGLDGRRRFTLDPSAGGEMIEITNCATGVVYRVRGEIVPPEEE